LSKLVSVRAEADDSHNLIFKGLALSGLTEELVARNTVANLYFDHQAYRNITPKLLEINQGIFTEQYTGIVFPDVSIIQQPGQLYISCNCVAERDKLCEHQALVLNAIIKRDEFRLFFDDKLRHEKLRKFAVDYGLENDSDPDSFFAIAYVNKKLVITPKQAGLMPVTRESLNALKNVIIPDTEPANVSGDVSQQAVCVVLKEHKYYHYLFVELYRAQITKEGKIKNPLTPVAPLDFIWETDDALQLKFFTGVSKFQNHLNTKKTDADITALKAIIKNPLNYAFYYHDNAKTDNITAASVFPVRVDILPDSLTLTVTSTEQFFELAASIKIGAKVYQLNDLSIAFTYFILADKTLYLVDNLQVLNVIDLLKKKSSNLLVHASKFPEFKGQWLTKLEDKISIVYKHIKPATQAQLKQQGFDAETERIIYLSDFGRHVMIIPVMRYGEVEISVRTKKQIYAVDNKGKEFLVQRNDDAEINFTALLIRQHPDFEEQLHDDLHYFYLHKRHFLNEDWFLEVFDEWQQQGITILGFNELEGNKLNPHKVKISIKVLSGINWFNTQVNVRFGKSRAALKPIYRAVKNKTKYVQLDDGTIGILPAEWIEKFTDYFNSGEIADDETLRVPRINFSAIEQFYDAGQLDEGVQDELNLYRKKLTDFDSIKPVEAPAGLNATLRPYQIDGLSWLNFLDDFNFGGCLADDMGLGKSIQVIAFILSQRAKIGHTTNLIVVPTSLIFNWQQEVQKFAPSIKIHTIYGADRIKNTTDFGKYEIILTSYGTLLADIVFIRNFEFNYIFLDESQNIKNPESQRYKTVRLLRSRNKITITGTPIENNTFDIYGQLSFACPGLLGSKQYFKEIYSAPIDMFKNTKRAVELQNKIRPFILRRTKQQVAAELPEKTEMVLYCEMAEQQRDIYTAYERNSGNLLQLQMARY
jgi:hypothetical protein